MKTRRALFAAGLSCAGLLYPAARDSSVIHTSNLLQIRRNVLRVECETYA